MWTTERDVSGRLGELESVITSRSNIYMHPRYTLRICFYTEETVEEQSNAIGRMKWPNCKGWRGICRMTFSERHRGATALQCSSTLRLATILDSDDDAHREPIALGYPPFIPSFWCAYPLDLREGSLD